MSQVTPPFAAFFLLLFRKIATDQKHMTRLHICFVSSSPFISSRQSLGWLLAYAMCAHESNSAEETFDFRQRRSDIFFQGVDFIMAEQTLMLPRRATESRQVRRELLDDACSSHCSGRC